MRVAQKHDSGVTISQVAADFGISETCLRNWLKAADIDAGARAGVTTAEGAELREPRKRNRLLEQENEVLRRAAGKRISRENDVPARDRARLCRDPRHGDVQALEALPSALLPLAAIAHH